MAESPAIKHAPRRRPRHGGYARGDETRAQIVEAALRMFGERGFDQASTRDIATHARVNPPALQYYFESKEGLHRACAQHIIGHALPQLKPFMDRAMVAAAEGEKPGALAALENLLDALIESLAQRDMEIWSRFIVRGKHDGAGPGMALIREQLSRPMMDAVSSVVGVITGLPKSDEMSRLRTLLVLGQIHWMNASREEFLKVMCWPKLDSSKVAIIKQIVREHTRAVFKEFFRPPPNTVNFQ
jgi:TetR/AcrR family transcriptional regulator, regulator of cefoperazone and chloramphenicol sensitivity